MVDKLRIFLKDRASVSPNSNTVLVLAAFLSC